MADICLVIAKLYKAPCDSGASTHRFNPFGIQLIDGLNRIIGWVRVDWSPSWGGSEGCPYPYHGAPLDRQLSSRMSNSYYPPSWVSVRLITTVTKGPPNSRVAIVQIPRSAAPRNRLPCTPPLEERGFIVITACGFSHACQDMLKITAYALPDSANL